MCGCTIVHVTNFNQNDHRNHDYQIISIVDPLPCHVSIHKHITSTNCLSEWYTQYTPKAKPTLFPEHKFKLAIGSKVQNPPPPPLPSSTLLQSKTQKAWPKPTTTTTPISSPPWSQTSNPTLATTLFSHGSGMPLSLSLFLFVGSSFNGFKK